MVAVIAGNGLGLANTSLPPLGQGPGGQAVTGQGGVAQYFNAATGNLTLQNADEGLIFDGLPLAVLRTYNSQGQLTGNQGWLFGFSRSIGGLTGTLGAIGSTVTRAGDDGSMVTYVYDAARGLYASSGQSGTEDTLTWNASSSTWTWTDGTSRQQETYNASGVLTELSDAQTGARYSFSYSNGQLSQIVAGDGDTLIFGYDAAGQLTSLSVQAIPPGQSSAVTRQQVGYTYDAQGRLSTVVTTLASDTHPDGTSYTTTYTYDGSSDRIASVSQSDGTVVSYTYAADANGIYRLTSITTGTGAAAQTLALHYDLIADTTTITNALGQAWSYTYDSAGRLSAVSAPTVNGITPATTYQYDGNGNLVRVVGADGGITTTTYDSRGNRLSVEDATGHTVSYTYNADDRVLSQTVYTVPAQGVVGQSGYVAPSGAQTTYYVYDASDRLSYVIDPLGQVTENDYSTANGLTVLSSTRQYIGVNYDLAGISPATPPSLAGMQGWMSSAPVQAVRGRAMRTDYTYDIRGQLATQTQWDVLGSSGTGTLGGDVGTLVTTYTYDAQGRLLQSATGRGADRTTLDTTSYAYDGLGRLISTTDPLGHVTSYVYTDSNHTLAITQANGLTTTQVRNSAGQLISSTQSASGQTSRVTTYLYNAAGQSVATIDPAGQVSYTFYDADGRVAGTVDATGAVTAISYDADGHVAGTTQYATLINTGSWVSGGALTASFPAGLPTPAPNAGDRTTHRIVDAAGRLVATIDALGHVATILYDGAGNATTHTAYATALSTAQLTTLGAAPTWTALQGLLSTIGGDHRSTVTIHDADGRVAATIDATGVVSTLTYDAAGNVVQTRGYAIALTPTQRTALGSTPSLADLQADLAASDSDQITRNVYDAAGRLVAQVDAGGYLTTQVYDETTHTDTSRRYATALTAAQLAALTGMESVSALVALLGTTPSSQVSSNTYNADNQLTVSTAVDGTVTRYSYNAVGQVVGTTVTPGAGQGSARTVSATYDAFGDTLTQVDGVGSTATYTYNTLGQRTTATDALGNITYTYYDADGRVVYTVQGQPVGGTRNARGNVTVYTYNAFGQVASTRRSASQLTLTSGSSSGTTLNPTTATLAVVAAAVAALPVSSSDADSLTTYTYTLDGQVAGAVDARGYHTAYTYDAFGDRTQVQQQLSAPGSALSAANSTISNFTYDARSEQTGETDAPGTTVANSTSRTYDAFGRVTSVTDGNGHVVTYGYDKLGRQVSSSQAMGILTRATQTTYDAFARVVTQTDALGDVTTYQYDVASHKTIVTTPDGVTMTTVRNAYGDKVSVTDGAGDATVYTYDADGQRLTTTDALGNTGTNQYDAGGNLAQTTDATGHVVSYSYDASGRMLSRTVDPGAGHLNLTTTYAYDGEGRELSVTDPTGMVTTYTYDADGNVLTQVQDAGTGKLNVTTSYTYDGGGKALTVTVGAGTAAARSTQYVYDSLERLSQQIVDPGTGTHLHLTTSYFYDDNDNLTRITDANGHTTLYVYDDLNERAFTIDPTGSLTQTLHDLTGRVTGTRRYATALDAAQLAELGNSPTADDVATIGFTIGSVSDVVAYFAYDADGRLRYTVNTQGYITETRYDAAGRLSETLAYAHPASASAVNAIAWPLALGTGYASMAGLVSGAGNTDATAEATLHLYDADGQQRFVVQQNTVNGQLVGVVSEQRYDAAGRVIASTAYGTTLPLSTTQPLSAQLTTSSVTQALASAAKQVTSSVYDAAGRLRYTVDATNHVIETRYDADGRIVATLAYANAIALPGTLTEATLASAVTAAGTAGARTSTTTYDATGRVLTTGDALGTNATYSYDATGLTLGQADRDGHWTWMQYDKAGRLTLSQSPPVTVGSYGTGGTLQTVANQYLYTTYGYDGVGNVTAISRGTGPDSAHVTVLSTTGYAYDAAGHQVATTYPGGVSTHVIYNALGQAVVDLDPNGHYQYKVYNTDGELAYAIDADGYVTGTTYDAYGNVATVTRYATALNTALISNWSAGQPLTQAQLQQGLVTSASGDRTITTTYDLRNQKTSVVQGAFSYPFATGPHAGFWANGAPTTRFTYDAFGNLTSTSVLVQGDYGTAGQSGYLPAVWATTYSYYDALNRNVMDVDPMGYVTTRAYNSVGQVTRTTEYANAIGTAGLTTATQPGVPAAGGGASGYDRVTTYTYDSIGRKTNETLTGGFSHTNNTAGLGTASTSTSYTYDGEGRVASINVNGAVTTTSYDALGRIQSVTEPSRLALVANWSALLTANPDLDLGTSSLYTSVAPVTAFTYDALGNALSTTRSAPGATSQVTYDHYDALGRLVLEVDANGVSHNTAYDAAGNITRTWYTLTGNGASSTVTTTSTYDATNQRLSTVTTRSGQTDSAIYVKYNAFGEVVARGDSATSYEETFGYNVAGYLISGTDATHGVTHSYARSLTGALLQDQWTPNGIPHVWISRHLDLDGRVLTMYQPSYSAASGQASGTMLSNTYDRWGNVLSSTDANGNVTTYLYDSQNHLVQQVEPIVLVVSATGVRAWVMPTHVWYYNVNGELTGVTDENGHTSSNTYDAAGNLIKAWDAASALTYTGYDALGRAVVQETPPVKTATGTTAHITYTVYDNLNQIIEQGDYLLNSAGTARTRQAQQTYVLNSAGDRIRIADALGNTAYYGYDSQHRVLSSQTPLQHAGGTAATFTYDARGNKTGETTANGDHQSWVVDYFGRVQSHVDLSGATTTYTYDAGSGLLTGETSNWAPTGQTNPGYLPGALTGSGSSIQYQYYANGQLAQVIKKTATTIAEQDNYQYDANGNRTVDIAQTIDGAGQVVHTETVTVYDSHNRLAVVTTENPDNSVTNTRVVYNYDAVGNRRAVFTQSAYGPTSSPISGNGGAPTGAVGTQTLTPGAPWNLGIASNFVDNLGFGLTFTATQANGSALPAWMSFNSNGIFSGNPAAAGSWSIKVTATDVNGQSVSSTFTVTVPVVAPVFTAGAGNQTGSVHGALNFSVAGATDANGSALTYSAKLSSGAALPSWLSFNASTRTFSGTPPVGSIGNYALKVTASAANGGTASETFTLTVAPTAPVYAGGVGNQALYGGRAFSFAYAASDFTEADGDALVFSAGSYVMSGGVETRGALPSWMSFNASTRTFTGTPPTSANGQSFNLYLMATNPQGQLAEAHFTVTVSLYVQPAPVYHGTLVNQTGTIGGSSLNITLPSGAFTEPDGGALTYSGMVLIPQHQLVELGPDLLINATSSTQSFAMPSMLPPGTTITVPAQWVPMSQVGLSINATTGAITGVPTTLDYLVSEVTDTYQRDSSYQLEVIATNGQGGTAAAQFTLTNSLASPTVTQAIANPAAKNPGAGAIQIVQSNTFSDPYGAGLTYSAKLSSGAALPAGLSWSGSTLTIGTLAGGSYAIVVTAKDGLGHTGTASFTLTVNNVAPVISGAMTNQTSYMQTAMASYQAPAATDVNSDAITYSATGLPPGVSFNAATRTFSGTPTATGTYTVTYKATDSKGASSTKTFTFTVLAATLPPVYGSYPNQTGIIGRPLSIPMPAGAFTSPGGQALTYTAMVLIPQHQLVELGPELMAAATYSTQSQADPSMRPPGTTITVPAQWVAISTVGLSISANGTISGTPRTLDYLINETTDAYRHDLSYQLKITASNAYGSATGQFTLTNGAAGTASVAAPTLLTASLAGGGVMSPNLIPIDPGGGGDGGGGSGGGGTPPPTLTPNIESYWFTYDADNRVVISDGSLVNGVIKLTDEAMSYELGYDAAGNATVRTTINSAGTVMTQASYYDARNELVQANYSMNASTPIYRGVEELRSYDPTGKLAATEQFYALGTIVGESNMPYWKRDPDLEEEGAYDGTNVGGTLASATIEHYDASGQLLQEQSFGHPASWRGDDASPTVPTTLPVVDASTWGGLNLLNAVTYKTATGATGYDAAGNVTAYSYFTAATSRTDRYTVSYQKKDSYLEKATSGSSSDSNYRPATDTSYYDSLGERIAIVQHVQLSSGTLADTVRAFAFDASGQIVQRRDGTVAGSSFIATGGAGTTHYAYVNGQSVGGFDDAGNIDVLDGLTAFSNSESGTSGYVTQFGDTLKSIAQAQYGNASLWYVIAQANALSSDDDLVAGQTLSIPQVTTHGNDAATFRPYDPSRIAGSTTPPSVYAPPPPPPPSKHCNALAAIVIIAVAVIVSVVTYGALSGEMAGWAAGALAGAAGSAASQVAGNAMGTQHGFDWGQVALGAVGGAIGGAVASELSSSSTFGTTFTEGAGANGLNAYGNAVAGAASYVGNYEASKLLDEPAHFSWAGLVASAAGSAVGGKLGSTREDVNAGRLSSNYWGNIGANAAQDVVTREVSVGLGDNHVKSWEQVGEDVFGNALGNAAVAGLNYERQKKWVDELGKKVSVNVAQVDADVTARMDGAAQGAMSGVAAADTRAFDDAFQQSTDDWFAVNEPVEAPGQFPAEVASLNRVSGSVEGMSGNASRWIPYGNAKLLAWGQPAPRERAYIGVSSSSSNALPPIEAPSYQVAEGYFEQAQDIAVQGYNDPNNSLFQRGVYAVLGGLEEPLNLAESAVRGMMNVPADAAIAAQNFAAASLTDNTDDRLTYIGNGLGAAGTSLLNLAGIGGLLGRATMGTVLDVNGNVPWRVVTSEGGVPNTADALSAGVDVRVSSRPQWLQRLDAGNDFNAERASAYPYNEVYVNKADGSGYYRLDSYDPAAGEIVSRKFTQLSDVQENTAVRYINEISAKYPVNGVVANVQSSGDLSGQLLRGQYYLEVPVQARPIPQSVLDAANRQGVLIRDINGKVY
mgnify:CR=1 FL=1